MKKGLRCLSWSLWSAAILASGQMACSHGAADTNRGSAEISGSDKKIDANTASKAKEKEYSVTGTIRTATENGTDKVKTKGKKAIKRTQAAADHTAAVVRGDAPAEGSDEEYLADVDAAMGDQTSPSAQKGDEALDAATSTAINSEADNSRVNRLHDGEAGVSAFEQGDSTSDIEITRKIRRSIVNNKALSIYAHNVKIITRDGRVILKGPVRSEDERKIVEDSAITVAGADHVTSGLEVKAK